jgi:uncharacterized RDD family membrane protein YckC
MEVISGSPSLTLAYSNFWQRVIAYIIDRLIVGMVAGFLFAPLVGLLGFSAVSWHSFIPNYHSLLDSGGWFLSLLAFGAFGSLAIVALALNWIYFAGMESSHYQATLGKMIMGIRVTSIDGNRITFLNATGRYFGKILSGLVLMAGYIMAAFTPRHQALHDVLAGTLVVKN